MHERPILFSAPMVRALLAGTKTQTRRAVKLPNEPTFRGGWEPTTVGGPGTTFSDGHLWSGRAAIWNRTSGKVISCPYGDRGNLLWVKEQHALIWPGDGPPEDVRDNRVEYRADTDGVARPGEWPEPGGPRWRPSIHMHRWASRITLEVTGVRVERLHDITEEDARAEGVDPRVTYRKCYPSPQAADVESRSYRDGYAALWDEINGAESWKANLYVWVVEFRRC